MIRAHELFPALSVAAALVLACGSSEAPVPTKVAPAAEPDPGASEPAPAEADQPAAAQGTPTIASDAAVHDFGGIKATDSIEHEFTIRNVGTADLKIERVQRT